jgi:putative acetyltransferase
MPEPPVRVRAFVPADLAAVHAVLICPGVWPYLATDGTLTIEGLERRLASPPGQRVVHQVAEIEERVVGTSRLRVWPEPRMAHSGSLTIGVHDDFHGRGVGSALMRALLAQADGPLGLARVQLEVDVDNQAAIALYQKMGFEVEGRLRGFKLRDGRPSDALVMARLSER